MAEHVESEPISSYHYHNWQKVTGLSSVLTDEDIYENNLAIQIWKQAQISESDSANCKEESIYINTEQYSRSQGRDAHL
ncbi:hypothetical protein E2320_018609 [Naja naja]|nr:hypothetical protein E2320_018609 [Naja naja]